MVELQRGPKTFEELKQFLKEQENILMTELMSQVLFEKRSEYSSRLSEMELLLDTVTAQLEKQDQPAVRFLTDAGRILSSYETRLVSLCSCAVPSGREMVTLGPETANPYLVLWQNHKVIRQGNVKQNLPDTSKRFLTNSSVLGSPGFMSGRHYWEVEVVKGDGWAVGVALESVPRKDFPSLIRSGKIWALQLDQDGQ
ncbi:hypothetical protein DUI87_29715 [Hirundo rustica rustica]|uniref:B30.2/SPRY domain-containing protein n=1 Tax=Hirundo rustica rustica TaxID=333673 RepID=A0A3M0IZ51_HIRRU|nr:hypothetical protein DUI87_29715 [Hirundo rustica rustica]